MAEVTSPHSAKPRRESPLWAVGLLVGLFILVFIGMGIARQIGDTYSAQVPVMAEWLRVLGVLATLAIFSILYQENPIFRFFEHIFIGLATGYGVMYVWVNFMQPRWLVPMLPESMIADGQGQWWLVFAALLGLLFFTVYFPKLSWMNRFALGVIMGWAAGAALQMFVGLLGPQLVAAFRAPVTRYALANTPVSANNIPIGGGLWLHPFVLVAMVVLICTLTYFFFSVEHRARWIKQPALAGRYFLMITLGAIFGTTVMGRLSLLIARMDVMLRAFQDWWGMLLHWVQALG
jgi:hypothetical protein